MPKGKDRRNRYKYTQKIAVLSTLHVFPFYMYHQRRCEQLHNQQGRGTDLSPARKMRFISTVKIYQLKTQDMNIGSSYRKHLWPQIKENAFLFNINSFHCVNKYINSSAPKLMNRFPTLMRHRYWVTWFLPKKVFEKKWINPKRLFLFLRQNGDKPTDSKQIISY